MGTIRGKEMSVQPRTFLTGVTQPDLEGLQQYLDYTGQHEFLSQFEAATEEHGGAMCLVSFYAKLCYKSLVLGKNDNVSKIRDIEKNIMGTFDSGHGSVFEHVGVNFVTADCSRVFTHELVRHRVGTAYSQQSGRYVTVEDAQLVLPPEFDDVQMPCKDVAAGDSDFTLKDAYEEKLGELKQLVADARVALDLENKPMSQRKWWTSALRRIMPNGATNDIGWSVNVRSLRHLIEMRTSRHAEWEIRVVFNEVADIIQAKWPLMLYGAKVENVNGMNEYTNLKV